MERVALPPLGGHLTRENVHYGKSTSGFAPEYKDEAVKLVVTTGRAVATVAREVRAMGRDDAVIEQA